MEIMFKSINQCSPIERWQPHHFVLVFLQLRIEASLARELVLKEDMNKTNLKRKAHRNVLRTRTLGQTCFTLLLSTCYIDTTCLYYYRIHHSHRLNLVWNQLQISSPKHMTGRTSLFQHPLSSDSSL
jgi:hypothetical protein